METVIAALKDLLVAKMEKFVNSKFYGFPFYYKNYEEIKYLHSMVDLLDNYDLDTCEVDLTCYTEPYV